MLFKIKNSCTNQQLLPDLEKLDLEDAACLQHSVLADVRSAVPRVQHDLLLLELVLGEAGSHDARQRLVENERLVQLFQSHADIFAHLKVVMLLAKYQHLCFQKLC